jgi:hypothetical protein
MILNIILLFGLYLGNSCISANITFVKSIPIFDSPMIIKNQWLRWRLSREVIYNERRARIINRVHNRKISELFDKVCGKYYDYLYKYYSSSEEDKYLLEFVLSSTY